MMLNLLTLCCCLLTDAEVTVVPLSGSPVSGKLVALSETKVTIEAPSGTQDFAARELQTVRPTAARAAGAAESAAALKIELVDGSAFPAEKLALREGKCTIQSAAGKEWTAAAEIVRTVRFHRQDEPVRKQWLAIAAEEPVEDVLVVRKVNPATTGAAEIVLDQISGVVHEVNEKIVAFEYDGEKLDVSLARIEGVIFRARRPAAMPEPACRVRDIDGGVWSVASLQLDGSELAVKTAAGMSVPLGFDRLAEVDYSAANVVFLADLETESVSWRPYFQSALTPRSLSQWFEPRTGSVILNGESYGKSLALHSRTVMSYRLTDGFRQLVGVAGIDDRYRNAAHLTLTIFGDDRQLLSRTVTGTDEPFPLAVDVTGVRRLRIVVDFGEDRSDTGDLLYLGDIRLVK